MTFDDLLVSGDDLDKELLVQTLKPYLQIEKETLAIRPLAPWRSLTAKGKTIAFLLARKGLKAHGMLEDERASPGEVIKATGIPSGSVHPALKALYEQRPKIVERDSQSHYWVPNWAVGDAVRIVTKEDDVG